MQKIDDSSDFDRTWNEFKVGFGVTSGNYWLGNEQIHQLTKDDGYQLRVDIVSAAGPSAQQTSFWAEYTTFSVGDEASNYQVSIDGYSGDAGDPVGGINGSPFTSKDVDNDDYDYGNCAEMYVGGFWHYNECYGTCQPTGGVFICPPLPQEKTTLITVQMWLQCK